MVSTKDWRVRRAWVPSASVTKPSSCVSTSTSSAATGFNAGAVSVIEAVAGGCLFAAGSGRKWSTRSRHAAAAAGRPSQKSPPIRRGASRRSSAPISSREGTAGRRAFNSASNFCRSSSMAEVRRQFLAQRRQGIAVARRRGVGRNFQLPADFLKGEIAPNLEREDLALLGRQAPQRRLDRHAPLVAHRQRLKQWSRLARLGLLLARGTPLFPPGPVECGAADGREQKRQWLAAQPALPPPETDKCILDHVLGVGQGPRPLPGAEQQSRAITLKPVLPGVIIGSVVHAGERSCFPSKRHRTRNL